MGNPMKRTCAECVYSGIWKENLYCNRYPPEINNDVRLGNESFCGEWRGEYGQTFLEDDDADLYARALRGYGFVVIPPEYDFLTAIDLLPHEETANFLRRNGWTCEPPKGENNEQL